MRQSTEKATGGKHNALAFGRANAGQRTAMSRMAAAANFDKHQRALPVAHNQVNLATAAPGGAEIALDQLQALCLQERQGLVLGGIALAFAAEFVWMLKGCH